MKRIALALAAVGAVCWWRSRHDPVRHLLGGQICRVCHKAGADRDALGEDGTVRDVRAFSRENGGSFVRGQRWREDVR